MFITFIFTLEMKCTGEAKNIFFLSVMYFYIYISILFCNAYSSNGENVTDNVLMKVTDITNIFITLFNNNNNRSDSERIKDLKEKLIKIDSYVVDKDKYAELIQNTSKHNDLNATNFYEALRGQDHFRLLNHSKNLYLTMKEKMNSDDLLRILSERGEEQIRISARRMLTGNALLIRQKDKDLAETVDKYLGEIATDYHTFDDSVKLSNYWDPKIELEERQQHNQLSGRRLYKGERTNIRYYPFIVSVHVMGKFWCGGCIYWNDLIITSAACLQIVYNNRFYRENPKVITVRVGSNHSLVGGEIVEALEVYFHPSYSPKTSNNNIALIRLRRQIRINYHRTPKLIQISHNDQGISFNAQVLLLGWGITKENERLKSEPKFLQRKFLPIYPATYCKEIYGDQFNPQSMFCAGTVTTGEGACNHDAGGPAILNGMLVGIISYGPAVCGFPDAPTVLTMVGAYADWIETVNDSMPGYYRANARSTTVKENTIYQEFAKWKENQHLNIKRIAPAIFVNEEDYREAEDRGQMMFRARLTDDLEENKPPPVLKKSIPMLQPFTTTAYSRIYGKTNSLVRLTVRQVEQKLVHADDNKPKSVYNEQRKEESFKEKKEYLIDVNKNQDDDDKQEESLQTLLPTPSHLNPKIYDKGQYVMQSGRLMQQLQSLTGISEEDEPAGIGQKTYTSKAKYMGLPQKIKPITNRLKTEVKKVQMYDDDVQSTIDDNIDVTREEIETTSDAIYPENEEKRENTLRPRMAQQEYEYEDGDDKNIVIKLKAKKQLSSPSDDQLNERKSSYKPYLPNR